MRSVAIPHLQKVLKLLNKYALFPLFLIFHLVTDALCPRSSPCLKTARALIEYGALIVRDSRVHEEANQRFLDLCEDYFAQDEEELKKDLRPEVHYQVGVTLENTEKVSFPKFRQTIKSRNVST